MESPHETRSGPHSRHSVALAAQFDDVHPGKRRDVAARTLLADFLVAQVEDVASSKIRSMTEIERALSHLLATSRELWPGIQVEDETFVAHLGKHLANDADHLAEAIAATRTDLFLACACALGNAKAIAVLEKRFFCDVPSAVARMRLPRSTVDELTQVVRQKLLLGEDGDPPKIADYAGRGPLDSWVRVVAVRTALSLLRKKTGELPSGDDALMNLPTRGHDPELDLIRARHAGDFSTAFQASLMSITAQERTILRLHFVDGLNIDQIGSVYRVHRSTVARWIARSREALLLETRRQLTAKLNLTPSEFDSLMGAIQSQLQVSIRRFLTNED
jgi:RNA polymerase sigma-70 factor (ECF subfamily)